MILSRSHVLATAVALSTAVLPGMAAAVPLDPGQSAIRVLHASPDAPPVDLFVDGAPTSLTGLAFQSGTPYVTLPSGPYQFDVVPTGGAITDSVLTISTVLGDQEMVSAVAYNQVASISGLTAVDEEPSTDTLTVRAFHTAVGFGNVTVVAEVEGIGTLPLFNDLAFGTASDPLDIPPGLEYRVGISTEGDVSPEFLFDFPQYPGGTLLNVYAATDGGEPFLLAQENDGTVVRFDPISSDPANVRFLHASPDAPPVDVFVDGAPTSLTGLAFQSGTPYVELPAGDYTVDIVPTGGTIDDTVLTVPVSLAAGTFYTASAYDTVTSLTALAVVDDYSVVTTDTLNVRAIHHAVGVGTVNIVAIDGTDITPLVPGLAFGAASDLLTLPPGAYRIGLDTDDDLVPDVVFDLPPLPGGIYANVYAVADAGGPFLLAQLNDSSVTRIDPVVPAQIRALHASPDAPPVDLYVNGQATPLAGLPFGLATPYVPLPPGPYTFDIVPTGGTIDDTVLTIPLVLEEGTLYSAAAYDFLANITALSIVDDYDFPTTDTTRIRAIHTASGVGEVDVLLLGEPNAVLFGDLAFGAAADALDVPAGTYSIGLDLDNDLTEELRFDLPELDAGDLVNIYAVANNDGAFLLLQGSTGPVVRVNPTDTPDPASIRFLHASPDAPPVDLYVDGLPSGVSGLTFENGIDYVELPAGTYDFDIVPTGGTIADSVLTVTQTLAEGEFYSAAAFDNVADIKGVAFGDSYDIPAGDFRFRVIHTAVGVGEVDLFVASSTTGVSLSDLGFGEFTPTRDVAAGQYDVRVDANNDGNPDIIFELPGLPEGTLANVYVVTDANGPFLLAQINNSSVLRVDPSFVSEGPASIRFLHASPDAPPVDLFVDGAPTSLTGLTFQNGTPYVELPAGTYDFDVVPTGGTIDDSVLTVTQTLADGQFYSASAFDNVATIQGVAFVDEYDIDADRFRVRVIHNAAGVGEVDILITGSAAGASIADLAFGEVSSSANLPVGNYNVRLDANNDGEPEYIFELPSLPAGSLTNVYAVADAGGPFLLAQLDDSSVVRIDPFVSPAGPASIRFLHASPDAPPVDLYVDGAPTNLTGLTFQNGTAYVELPAGTYDFDVVPTGGTIADSVLTVTQTLAEDGFYSASAFDNVATIQGVAFEDTYDVDPANIRIRAIHNAAGVGEVDLLVIGSAAGANITDLGFGEFSGTVDAPAGQYDVRLDANNDGEPEFVFELPSLPGGTVANVYAVADAGGPFLLAQLNDSSVTRIDPVPGDDTGDGSFDNPYEVLVSEGGRTGITIDRPEDYLAVSTGGQTCTGIRLTLERTSGTGELFIQVMDPRCPDNGPGTFPRLIAANYATGPSKSVVYIDQSTLEPVLVRVFQPGAVETVTYSLIAEGLAFDDNFEQNDTADVPANIPNGASVTLMDLILRDDDWYLINTTAGETVDVFADFNGASGDVNLQVFDLTNYFGGGFPTEVLGFSYGFGDTEAVSLTVDESTAIGVRVYGERGSTNVYDLTVQRTGGNAPRSAMPIVEFAQHVDDGQGPFAYPDETTLDLWAAADAALIINDDSDVYEPNQSPGQAANNLITLGSTGFSAVASDDDWYVIERQECGTLQLILTYDEGTAASPLGLQLFTEVCPPNGVGTYPRLIAADYTAVAGELNVVTLNTTGEERILARVYRLDSAGPNETIPNGVPYTVEIKNVESDDAIENNDVPWDPTVLVNPAVGSTDSLDHLILRDDDFFAVPVINGAAFTVTIEFPGVSGDLNLQVFDAIPAVGSPFPEPTAFSYGFGDSESVTITPEPGTTDILIRVYGERGSTNIYDLTYGWTAAP